MRAVHYFVTGYSDHGHMNVDVLKPKLVLKLAGGFEDARKDLKKLRAERK